jgi:hypothetical protein
MHERRYLPTSNPTLPQKGDYGTIYEANGGFVSNS